MQSNYVGSYYESRPAPVFGGFKSAFGLVALASFLCFAIVPAAATTIASGRMTMAECRGTALELIPFGRLLYWAVSEAFRGIFRVGLGTSALETTSAGGIALTGDFMLQELWKCIVSVAIFGALRLVRNALFGSGRSIGAAWRVLSCLVFAVVASYLTPLAIRSFSYGLSNVNVWLATIAPSRPPFLSADLGAVVLGVLMAIIVARFAFFALARFLVLGAVRLLVAHVIILTLIVGLQYLMRAPALEVYVALSVAVFVLCVAEAALD